MNYFDFSAHDNRVVIPKSRSTGKLKDKSCFVDHNKISKIKNGESLDRYNSMSSKKSVK